MANPQPDKFTTLSNEILEALCKHRIPGEVRQIIDVVIRQTYGWNKKTAPLNLARFALMTGLKKPSIIRSIHKAKDHGLIYISANGEYGFQKDFDQWKPFTKVLTIYKSANEDLQKSKQSFTKELTFTDEPKDSSKDIIKDTVAVPAIEYLNLKAKRRFKTDTPGFVKHIRGRVKEGADLELLKKVIDHKVWDWVERGRRADDKDMSQYLTPDTLFNSEKFWKYAEEVARKELAPIVKAETKAKLISEGQNEDIARIKAEEAAWGEMDIKIAEAKRVHGNSWWKYLH